MSIFVIHMPWCINYFHNCDNFTVTYCEKEKKKKKKIYFERKWYDDCRKK